MNSLYNIIKKWYFSHIYNIKKIHYEQLPYLRHLEHESLSDCK